MSDSLYHKLRDATDFSWQCLLSVLPNDIFNSSTESLANNLPSDVALMSDLLDDSFNGI